MASSFFAPRSAKIAAAAAEKEQKKREDDEAAAVAAAAALEAAKPKPKKESVAKAEKEVTFADDEPHLATKSQAKMLPWVEK